jgi:hypothetical protein
LGTPYIHPAFPPPATVDKNLWKKASGISTEKELFKFSALGKTPVTNVTRMLKKT